MHFKKVFATWQFNGLRNMCSYVRYHPFWLNFLRNLHFPQRLFLLSFSYAGGEPRKCRTSNNHTFQLHHRSWQIIEHENNVRKEMFSKLICHFGILWKFEFFSVANEALRNWEGDAVCLTSNAKMQKYIKKSLMPKRISNEQPGVNIPCT